MAKIYEEVIIVKLSKLVKTNEDEVVQLSNEEFESNLEAIVQELVGDSVIVEIERT
jgi:hypothetical protein